ncbi:hypothetical protein [Leifsonia shinshuensis]|uniref:Uncharacterized protein n=1 Tax=Leifsonia shinshuensis TaxID=150026 RepID=A0A7G6YBL9_9MICO|nr:hypothetical protein [Leifsonia shinshuensis]QNE35884.1 hypothetical protein F1C12_12600 [Leifsonia shinshuensis]
MTALLSGAVIAAIISFGGNYYFAIRKTREETRERLRALFAEAFAAYAAYREYPYVIRRRNADHPADERIRISELIRGTQERISYHLAATAAESDTVGSAYRHLIDRTRELAGSAMKDAWQAPAITEDRDVVIARSVINLGALDPDAVAYQKAVRDFLRAGRFGKRAN